MHRTPATVRTATVLLALGLLSACAGGAPQRADAPGAGVSVAGPPAPGTAAAPVVEPADAAPAEAPRPVDGFADDGVAEDALGPTDAELDYAALYGGGIYDPVADPTLPDPAAPPAPGHDPWEHWNRKVHAFNMAIDRAVAAPLARAYVKVVPRPVRLGVGNFFSNLGQPVSALNALLQGKPGQAGQSLGRFLVNATVGLGGLFDPASRMDIPNRSEDFGQTLGVWGWETSRYVELPLFGPRTVRDVFGLVGDGQVSPLRQVDDDAWRVGLQGLQLVDLRTQLFAVDRLREGAADEYALVRDAWMQRRDYQIRGDRIREDQSDLPDYLLDDEANPTVPVDVMPIIPGSTPP